MLHILSPLVHTWNCGDLKPDLWVVADSGAKRAVKTKFSWFSVGSDSILQTTHTGMADKITVCPVLELWGFRNRLQQFTAQSSRNWCWFTLIDCAAKGLELLYKQWFLQPRWSGVDGCHVSSPNISLSFLVKQGPREIVLEPIVVTSRVWTLAEKCWEEQPVLDLRVFSIGRVGMDPGLIENFVSCVDVCSWSLSLLLQFLSSDLS